MPNRLNYNTKMLVFAVVVLTVLVQRTHGQSYLLSLSQNQRNLFPDDNNNTPDVFLQPPPAQTHSNSTHTSRNFLFNAIEESEAGLDNKNTNTTIIVIKNIRENSNDLSQSAMDIITVVWYVATFLALAAFFLLMACSDRRCSDVHQSTVNEAPIPPPTPSPSYSEFAPPSYESVIKMQHANKPNIFVIPFSASETDKDDVTSHNMSSSTPTSPIINFYTINELQKFSS